VRGRLVGCWRFAGNGGAASSGVRRAPQTADNYNCWARMSGTHAATGCRSSSAALFRFLRRQVALIALFRFAHRRNIGVKEGRLVGGPFLFLAGLNSLDRRRIEDGYSGITRHALCSSRVERAATGSHAGSVAIAAKIWRRLATDSDMESDAMSLSVFLMRTAIWLKLRPRSLRT